MFFNMKKNKKSLVFLEIINCSASISSPWGHIVAQKLNEAFYFFSFDITPCTTNRGNAVHVFMK